MTKNSGDDMNFNKIAVVILVIATLVLLYAVYYEFFSKQYPLSFNLNIDKEDNQVTVAPVATANPSDSRKISLNPAASYLADAYLSNSEAVVLGKTQNEKIIPLLTVDDLPKSGFLGIKGDIENKSFNFSALSPDYKKVAFSVAGQVSWMGLLDTEASTLTPLMYIINGNIGKLAWSPDSNYVTASVFNNNGVMAIRVADVRDSTVLTEFGNTDKKVSAYDPQWSPSGIRIIYKMKATSTGQIKDEYYDFMPRNDEKPVTNTSGSMDINFFQKQLAEIESEIKKYNSDCIKKGGENPKQLNLIVNKLLRLLHTNIGDGCCNRIKNILNKRDDDYPPPFQKGIKYTDGYKEFTFARFMDMMKTGESPLMQVGVETTISDACEGLGALNNKQAIPAIKQRLIKELDKLVWNQITEDQVSYEGGEPETFSVLISAARALERLTDPDKKLRYRPHYFHVQY